MQELGAEVVPAEYGGQAEAVPIEVAVRRLPCWQQQQQGRRQEQQQHEAAEAATVGAQLLRLGMEEQHYAAGLELPAVAVES